MKTQAQEHDASALSLRHPTKRGVAANPKWLLRIAVPLGLAAGLCASAALAWDDDDDHQGGAVKLLTTIPIPPTKGNADQAMKSFDISWVDANTRRYFLADRSNKVIDVIDTKTNKVVDQIPTNPPFAGASGNNDTSGPNGVVVSGHWLFASDCGASSSGCGGRVVTIDLNTKATVSDVSTGGSARADEMAYDPQDGLLLAVNNADDPPFATLIKVDPGTGKLTVKTKILLSAKPTGALPVGMDATNGAEQPVWEPHTGRFYLSLPEISRTSGAAGTWPIGGVARINPSSGAVETVFLVKNCQPAGLTLGPKQDLLLGCGVAFDTAGNAWSLANPLKVPSAATAAPISIIMDAQNGSIDKTVNGVSGSDEVWFNSGDGRYYLAARNQPGGPVLGVIDAKSQKLLQVVPTVNQAAVPPPASVQAGSAHSVAADPHNNHVFVPLPTNNVFPNCLTGCVAVFGVPGQKHDD